jgi:beta-1,4-mannosyl-glycoprotein beta-1,4-N-acetylglucosaminyltransferase
MYLILDYFLYNGDPIIEYRLEYLNDYVDYFIMVEARYTHQGIKKPFLYSEKNKELFKKYEKKLIIIIIDDFPDKNDPSFININKNRKLVKEYSDDNWARETYNRNYAQNIILERFKNQPFIIFVCDVDEIPNRNIIKYLKYNYSELHEGVKLSMLQMTYNFRWKTTYYDWLHPFVITDVGTRNLSYNFVRLNQEGGGTKSKLIKNAGWHLSYFLTPNEFIRKIESYAHTECNKEEFKDRKKILSCMLSGYNWYNKYEKYHYTNENELPENWKSFQIKLDAEIFKENVLN